jgi:hypothetical protein
MIDRRTLVMLTTLAVLCACGSRTPLGEPVTRGGGGGGITESGSDGSGDGGRAASSGASTGDGDATAQGSGGRGGAPGPAPDPQCLCPDEPGFTACQLPFMCCPCQGTCENPDTFLCSCADPRTCL